MKERLQKVLAAAGVASRRRSEEMIAAGEVTVNGRLAQLGESVNPAEDVILVRGQRLASPKHLYVALNKPRGYVSSLRSTHGEATVLDLLDLPARVYPVGRLDKETSGLLLLTNDGDWANLITHPRYEIPKEYEALVRGRPPPQALQRLREGMVLPDGTRTHPAEVHVKREVGANTLLTITVGEGKKRQIRLMVEGVGHPVITLRRTRIGPIELDGLAEGRFRYLMPQEVERIRERRTGRAATGSAPARPTNRDRRPRRSR